MIGLSPPGGGADIEFPLVHIGVGDRQWKGDVPPKKVRHTFALPVSAGPADRYKRRVMSRTRAQPQIRLIIVRHQENGGIGIYRAPGFFLVVQYPGAQGEEGLGRFHRIVIMVVSQPRLRLIAGADRYHCCSAIGNYMRGRQHRLDKDPISSPE